MTTEAILNLVFSIVASIIAVIAVFISVIQIKKSNKQALFERRLKAYLTVKWMKALCDEHESISKTYLEEARKGPLLSIDLLFVWMTNCSALEEIQPVIHHILEGEFQRKYLLKMEDLRNLCEEVRLIFPENIGYKLADFIFYYEEMLVSIYKYQIAINGIEKECKENTKPLSSDNQLENSQRKIVVKNVNGTFELSKKLFSDGTFENAKKSIKI